MAGKPTYRNAYWTATSLQVWAGVAGAFGYVVAGYLFSPLAGASAGLLVILAGWVWVYGNLLTEDGKPFGLRFGARLVALQLGVGIALAFISFVLLRIFQ